MPPAGILAVGALAAISYLYVARPIAHGVKKAAHAVVHVVKKIK
jgi:hypothetical protein